MAIFSPTEITDNYMRASVGKAASPAWRLFLLAVAAGVLIGPGAVTSSTAAHGLENAGLVRLMSGLIFPVGLMMVILMGTELFTGNALMVTAAIDGSNGQVLSGPDLVSRGFVYVRESEELMEGARTQVEMALDRSLADNLHDWASVKARVREALSSYIYRRTKRSPMILPILLEV